MIDINDKNSKIMDEEKRIMEEKRVKEKFSRKSELTPKTSQS